MKKNILIVLFFVLASALFVSCASSDIKYYSGIAPKSEKIAIEYNTSATSVTDTGYWYSSYDKQEHPYVYSQSVNLSTVENREKIKNAFIIKGYKIVQAEEADSIAIVENKSDADYSKVDIAVYDKASTQLLFVCSGDYATMLLSAQGALDKALDEALSQIPPVRF